MSKQTKKGDKLEAANPTVDELAETSPVSMGQDLVGDCSAFQGRLGFRGQQYAVICKNHMEHWILLGWSHAADGGSFKEMVACHPTWHDLLILSLEQDEHKLAKQLQELAGHKTFMVCHLRGHSS